MMISISQGRRSQHAKKAANRAAFFFFRGWFDYPLPPITARTVSSGPKSSAPST
jgi:hypothetical protein